MRKIIHVLHIKEKPGKTFNAIATEEGLSNWWSTRVVAEEKIGGIIDFTFLGDFNPDMKITSLREAKEVKWQCVGGHEKWLDNRFSFELSERDDGTQVKFVQEYANEISDEDYGTYNYNWGYYLGSLKEYCETGKGRPFSAQSR